MSKYFKSITVEDVYVSVLTAKKVSDENGVLTYKKVEKSFPHTGSVLMDAIGRILLETGCWETEDFAQKLEVGVSDLRGAVRVLTGMPIADFVLAYRMRQAKEWLACTDLSIREVARRCGFRFSEMLSNRFRRYEKMTPKRYRETHRPSNFRELYMWK